MTLNLNTLFRTHLFHLLQNQKGVFSPFMLGLLMAISVFSVLSLQWAKKDLVLMEKAKLARQQAEADDLAKAVEFALMVEDESSFGDDLTIERLRKYAARSQGFTGGKENAKVIHRNSETRFDIQNEKIAIAITDDALTHTDLNRRIGDELLDIAEGKQAIAVVDTSAIRTRQIDRSKRNMESMAEQVYQFYAAQFRFPRISEYAALANIIRLKDVWGNEFLYTYQNDSEATLEFTSPWNYTYTMKLNLE